MIENDGMEALKELMIISNIMDLKHPNIINLCGRIERSLQALNTPNVSDSEVEGKWKQLENYVKDTLMGKIYIDELKQALTTPKISEDDLEFILKWAKIGIWQEREKRFNIMRRIKKPSTLSCYKIIIKELNSNYDRIRTLKSIGGNK